MVAWTKITRGGQRLNQMHIWEQAAKLSSSFSDLYTVHQNQVQLGSMEESL